MSIFTGNTTRTAIVTAAVVALLASFSPTSLQAQQAISAGEASKTGAKGLSDPDFVGKWDFGTDGDFEGWRPLQAVGVCDVQDGMVRVIAKSQRPCLDLRGPYSASQIGVIEIRMRGIEVKREVSGGSESAMGGAGDRTRILPQLYKGTRIYFTTEKKEKYDAAKSIELQLPLDGEFHVLTIRPADHQAWAGLIQKIRFDLGDFPNRYELDYVYFRRSENQKKSETRGDKSGRRVGALSTE